MAVVFSAGIGIICRVRGVVVSRCLALVLECLALVLFGVVWCCCCIGVLRWWCLALLVVLFDSVSVAGAAKCAVVVE